MEYIIHSAKGIEWKKHKYKKRIYLSFINNYNMFGYNKNF